MPVPMAGDMLQENHEATEALFPATTKQAAGMVKGVRTEVMTISFADKIVITIVQGGRLAQWAS